MKDEQSHKKMAAIVPFHEIEATKNRVGNAEVGMGLSNSYAGLRLFRWRETDSIFTFLKGEATDLNRAAGE